MAAGTNPIRLEEIVGGQRRMQVLSALLTLSGALGLAFVVPRRSHETTLATT
jgi:hypothetical protein